MAAIAPPCDSYWGPISEQHDPLLPMPWESGARPTFYTNKVSDEAR